MDDRDKTREQLIEKLAELRRSEEHHRHLLDEMGDGYVITCEGQVVFVNRRLAEMLGCSEDELVGRSWEEFVEPDVVDYVARTPMADLPLLDIQVRRPDGTKLAVEVAVRPATYQGDLAEFSVVRDVSERKRLEALMHIQRDLGVALGATFRLDKALRLCVEAAISVSGMDSGAIFFCDEASEALKLAFHKGFSLEFIASVSRRQADAGFVRLLEAGEPIYADRQELSECLDLVQRQEGLCVVAVIPVRHQGRIVACLTVASHTVDEISVTARNALETIGTQIGSAIARLRAEAALRESKELKFRSIVEHSMDGIVLIDEEGAIVEWNQGQEQITGLRRAEALARPLWDVFFEMLPEGRKKIAVRAQLKAQILEFLKTGQGAWIDQLWEQEIQHSDGTRRTVQESIFPIKSEAGFMAGGIIRDVTRRKRMEETLKRSEREKAVVLDSMSELVAYQSAEMRILWANRSAGESVGLTPEQLVGRLCYEVWFQRSEPCVGCPVVKARQTGQAQQAEMIAPGSRVWFIRGYPVRDVDGDTEGVVEVLQDITERKQAEEALQRHSLELALLNRAGRALISTLDLDKVLTALLDELRHLLGVLACSVWLIDPQTGELICRQATGPKSAVVLGWRLPPGKGIVGWVARDGQSLIVPDAQVDPRHFRGVDQKVKLALRSILSVPLRVTSGVIGVLQALDTEVDYFKLADLSVVEPLATTAAMAIENARLYEQARRDAETQAVLLSEVNHRVKNNLSTIIGLLYAARRHIAVKDQPVYQSIMNDLVNRVQGLATVHSLLSASRWAPLRLSDLATEVVRSALRALPHDQRVVVDVAPSPVRVTPYQANNLALVVNELTTNTVKYALPERDAARITVRIALQDDVVRFEFRDDGPGYPEKMLHPDRHSVELHLIQSIVCKSLRGGLSLHNDSGAVTIVEFKTELKSEERSDE